MYYYSRKSKNKIIHTRECGCVGSRVDSFGTLPTLQVSFDKGYCLCRRCNTVAKRYELEKADLINFCSQNGMMLRYENGILKVKSSRDEWILAVRGNGEIQLYHRNAYDYNKNADNPLLGCHLQKIKKKKFRTLMEYFRYIEHHDVYRQKNPFISQKLKSTYGKSKKTISKKIGKVKSAVKKRSVRQVLNLIDSMDTQYKVAEWV